MKITSLEKDKYDYLLAAFSIPFFGMCILMMIRGFEPFGATSMLYSDMYHQYYPFFVEFRRALLSGENMLWTWSVGMGMDYLGLISYYLASPLNLLSVLIPEDFLLEYFSLLLPIRMGLASLFFAIFLKQLFHRNDLSIALFGSFYGMCAWAMGYHWNLMWMDTFALLPLVVLGMVYLLRDRKFILYTITLFLSIYSNYYVGFFTCLFIFQLFFVYEICRWQGWKRFFQDLCRIAVFSLLAIGMTMVLELPALAALQNTHSSVNSFPDTFRLNIASEHTWEGLLDAMRQVAGNMGGGVTPNFKASEGLPNIYCGVGSVVLAFLFLTAKQVKLRDKICSVALLLFLNASFVIRQLDYIWHGFHFPNMIPYRFSFLYSFVILYMAYRAYLLHRSFKPWQYVVAGLLSVAVFSFSRDLDTSVSVSLYDVLPFAKSLGLEDIHLTNFRNFVFYNAFALGLYLLTFFTGLKRIRGHRDAGNDIQKRVVIRQIRHRNTAVMTLAVVMAIELVMNLVTFGTSFGGTGVSNYPRGTTHAASMIRYMQEREEDTLFYRAEVTHSQTLNDGALNNYDGITTFTSSANVKTTLFMQGLGYAAQNNYNRYLWEEGSPIANLFLNLKYMIERDGDVEENPYFEEIHHYGNVYLLENKAYLPLGFLANEQLANVEMSLTGNHFDTQDALMEAATGVSGKYWTVVSPNSLEINSETVKLSSISGYGICSYNAEKADTVNFTYTMTQRGFLCVDMTLPKRNSFTVYLNGTALFTESIALPQLLSISQVEPGDVVEIRFKCGANESSTLNAKAYLLDEALFWEAYDVLAASTLELTEFSTTYVEGTINANRNGLLYTSIPQDGNWYVTVDGQDVEPVLVGNVMIGVPLTEGNHTIAFTYRNKAFEIGGIIALVCLVIFLGLIFLCYKPQPKKGKFQKA